MAREIIKMHKQYKAKEDFLLDISGLPWDYRTVYADGSIALDNTRGARIAYWSGSDGLGWTNYNALRSGVE